MCPLVTEYGQGWASAMMCQRGKAVNFAGSVVEKKDIALAVGEMHVSFFHGINRFQSNPLVLAHDAQRQFCVVSGAALSIVFELAARQQLDAQNNCFGIT